MNTQSINEQLDAIAKRAEGATAGPFKPLTNCEVVGTAADLAEHFKRARLGVFHRAEDRDFCFAAREDVNRLLVFARIAKAALEYIAGEEVTMPARCAEQALARIADCLGGVNP